MKKKRSYKLSEAQTLLEIHLRELWPQFTPIKEYSFMDGRRFRFDLAILDIRLGFEVCGGSWSGGHRHGSAIERDYEKLNLAQMSGWRCLYFTNEAVLDGTAKEFLRKWA